MSKRCADPEITRLLPYRLQFCEDCMYWLPDCVCDEDEIGNISEASNPSKQEGKE